MTYISFFFHLQLYCLISQGALIEDTYAEAMCSDDQCQREKIGDTCFYLYGNSTWEENQQLCQSKGMQMSNMSASHHLQSDSVAWLGGRVKWFEKWTFVNGILLEETYHNPKSTAGTSHNLCGVVQYTKEDVTLSFANCMDTYRFICRFDDWRGQKTFYTSDLKANWFDAHSRCKALGADLYNHEKGEAVTIMKRKLSLQHNETFFIGLTHGIWTWENGQDILVENWPSGIQSITKGDCLAIDLKNNKWIAKKCDETLKALCEEKRTTTKNSSDGQDILVDNWPNGIQSITEGDILAIDPKNSTWITKNCNETVNTLVEKKKDLMHEQAKPSNNIILFSFGGALVLAVQDINNSRFRKSNANQSGGDEQRKGFGIS